MLLYQTARSHFVRASIATPNGIRPEGASSLKLTITTANAAIASTAHDNHGLSTGGAALFDNALWACAAPFFIETGKPAW